MNVDEKEENMPADLNAVHILFNLDICGNERKKIQSNQDNYNLKKEFQTNNNGDNLDCEEPSKLSLNEKGGNALSSEQFLLSSFGGMIDCSGYVDNNLEDDSFLETKHQGPENSCTKKRKWQVDDKTTFSVNNSISAQDARKIKHFTCSQSTHMTCTNIVQQSKVDHCHCGKEKNEKRKANLRKNGVTCDENASSDTKKGKRQKRVKFRNSKLKFTTDVVSNHKRKITPVNITERVTQNSAEVDFYLGEHETVSVTAKDGSLEYLLENQEVTSSNELPEEHQREVEKFNGKRKNSFSAAEDETLNFEHSYSPLPENKAEGFLDELSCVKTFTPTCMSSGSESLSCFPKTKEPVVESSAALTSEFDVDTNISSNLSPFSGIATESDSSSTKDDNHLQVSTCKTAISCSLINSDSAYPLNGKSVNNVHQSDGSPKQRTDVTKREQESFVILSSQIDDCSMDSIPMIYIDSDDSEETHCSVTTAFSQMEPINKDGNISKSDKAEFLNVNADNCISNVLTSIIIKDDGSVKDTKDPPGQAEISTSCKLSPNNQKEVGSDDEKSESSSSVCSKEGPLSDLPTTGQDINDINESSNCKSDGNAVSSLKATVSSISTSSTAFPALSDTLMDKQHLSDIIEKSFITPSYVASYDEIDKQNLFPSGVRSDIKENTDVHWTLQSPLTSTSEFHNNKNNIINHSSPSKCIKIFQTNQCSNISLKKECSYADSSLITRFGPDCSNSSFLCNAKKPVDSAVTSMPLASEIDDSFRCQSISLLSSSYIMSPLNHKKEGTLQPTYSVESKADSSFEADMEKYAGLFTDLESKLETFENRLEENMAKENETRKSRTVFDERFNKLEARISALQSKLEKYSDNEKFSIVHDASSYDRQMKLEARVAGLEKKLLTCLNSEKYGSECNKLFAKNKSDVDLDKHDDVTIMKIAGSSGPELVLRGIKRIIIDGEGYTERERMNTEG